jgi:hypothetical protein
VAGPVRAIHAFNRFSQGKPSCPGHLEQRRRFAPFAPGMTN